MNDAAATPKGDPAHSSTPSPPTAEAVKRSAHFREVIDYALKRLGDGHRLAVNRDLSALLDVSVSMVTRYRNGMDPYTVGGGVLARLAQAAGISVDGLFIWLQDGSTAAFAFERSRSDVPRAFSELDLARELVAMLERNPAVGVNADRSVPNYELLERRLQACRSANPAFDRLAQALPDGLDALDAVQQRADITPQHWEALAIMLSDAEPDFELRHCLLTGGFPPLAPSSKTAELPA